MTTAANKSRKPERLLLQVAKGALIPGDGYTQKRLKERGYRVGDILLADLRKPRSPGYHRLAHRLGQMIAENIEEFAGLDAHTCLKRLQIEANVACDEIPLMLDLLGQRVKIMHRMPRSLSWASMDEGEFRETMRALSSYVAATYWPDLTGDAIERMAELMPEAA